jgi:hypothetical protein
VSIERQLKASLGENFRAWHVREVQRLMDTYSISEEKAVSIVVKHIRRLKGK